MPISIHKELRHRGEPLVEYPGADLWKAVGGSDGVAALIKDLYRRIEKDELLREAFPHFNSGEATPFFMQWFGGSRGYSDDLAGGLLRRHRHRYISPKADPPEHPGSYPGSGKEVETASPPNSRGPASRPHSAGAPGLTAARASADS
jgi:hypothetical protein